MQTRISGRSPTEQSPSLPNFCKKISDGRSVSTAAAVLNIIKTNVGTGVYGLPTAVANAGLGLGVGAMVFINTITIHSMLLLVSF